MLYYVLAIACLLFSGPARAQAPDPLSYTARNPQHKDLRGGMHYKMLDYGKEKDSEDGPTDDELAAEKVWEKYRALAAGQYEEPKEKDTQDDDKKEKDKKSEDSETPPAQPGGITTLLNEYNRNKAQRSQMRIITVTPEPEEKKDDAQQKPAEK